MKNEPYPLYDMNTCSDLKQLLDFTSKNYGDKPAFSYRTKKNMNGTIVPQLEKISYQKFTSDVNALGTAFLNAGIKDSKIAVIGENSYLWIVTYFATVNGGNVIVPIDKELPIQNISNLLIDSQASVLVYSNDYKDIAEELTDNRLNIKYKWNMKNDLQDLINKGEESICNGNLDFIDYKINNTKLAAIIYTSGTTGISKGVMLSHKNLSGNATAVARYLDMPNINMLVLPLHHTFAFTASIIFMLYSGTEIAINYSLKNLIEDINAFKPTSLFLVPLYVETFYKRIWDLAKKSNKVKQLKNMISVSNFLLKHGIDIRRKVFHSIIEAFGSNLELIVSGGAPLDVKYVLRFREFGINVLNGYGITECSPIVSVNRNFYYRDGSVGLVLSGCEVKIARPDESGNGEVLVKGDYVMLGYYQGEEATKAAFEDGWFNTGDLGHLDEDGFLFITGRKKNLIITNNGKNVYPEEIEGHVLTIPYIKEVVVYSEENLIIAEVFLDKENFQNCDTNLDADILSVNKLLPHYKHINKTVIRESEFPKTSSKKIIRHKNKK